LAQLLLKGKTQMIIAGVQMDVFLEETDRNLDRMVERLRETSAKGAKLTVFPECALSGYSFENLAEARPFAQPIPGPASETIRGACAELGCYAIFGLLERDGDKVFNAAALVGPAGVIGSYRKVHLPYLGIDMFTSYGDRPFAVHSAGELKVGMNICYDAAFPEASRSLALLGADLIALPTNWPPGSECTAASIINARAIENAVYFIAVNRVGTERGFEFIGRSKISDPSGQTMAEARGMGEEILYADIDVTKSRRKHIIRVPDKHELDRLADRRPEMYGMLVQPHSLKTPRETHGS
jgi:predicted amidohydrolase